MSDHDDVSVPHAFAATPQLAGTRVLLRRVEVSDAEALAGRLSAAYPKLTVQTGSKDPAGFDIVVNASPLGMNADDPLPMDVDRIDPATFVGEVVMKSEMTPFLAAAAAKGCKGCADEAAEKGVGRAGRQSEQPREQVPENTADKAGKDHHQKRLAVGIGGGSS